jgi:ATP-dependent Clp protease ATP-binding subunit ClpA
MLSSLKKRLALLGVSMEITTSAMDLIISKGYDNFYGARPLRRVIQRNIEDKLSEEILRGDLKENSVITIDSDGENFTFNK